MERETMSVETVERRAKIRGELAPEIVAVAEPPKAIPRNRRGADKFDMYIKAAIETGQYVLVGTWAASGANTYASAVRSSRGPWAGHTWEAVLSPAEEPFVVVHEDGSEETVPAVMLYIKHLAVGQPPEKPRRGRKRRPTAEEIEAQEAAESESDESDETEDPDVTWDDEAEDSDAEGDDVYAHVE